jgi:general secretion pathway protein K
LWLSAALAAIAFSLSTTVRSETERASTNIDGLRCYYLAAGGIERAELEMLWGMTQAQPPIPKNATFVDYQFPSGVAHVEILPEAGKLNINGVSVEMLYKLVLALGVEPGRAREIALAIDDWRKPAAENSPFDMYYLAQTPSFRAPHTSVQEIEELLQVKGITPEIFYGTYLPAAQGGGSRLVARPGLADCLTVYGPDSQVDVNTASPAVLLALGLSADQVNLLQERRRALPFKDFADMMLFLQGIGAVGVPLRVGGNSIVTLRSTARLLLPGGKLSDVKRTVAAQVKFMPPNYDAPLHILRWYDAAWSN